MVSSCGLAVLLACCSGLATAQNGTIELQWATPVFVHFLEPDVAGGMKPGLLQLAGQLRAADPAGKVYSNRGGWRSDSNIHKLSPLPPVMAEVKKHINAGIASFWKQGMARTPHAKGKSKQPKLTLSAMWMNLLGLGGANVVHKHSGALFSGVYYVNTPTVPGGATGGSIKFRDPRPQTSVYDDLEWMGMGAEVQVNPSEGLMLIWPSWLDHYVEPLVPDSLIEEQRIWTEGTQPNPGELGRFDTSGPDNLRMVIAFNVGRKYIEN